MFKRAARAQAPLKENVQYVLRDANGNIKPIFTENRFGKALLRALRKRINPYNENGTQKEGLLARLALYGLQIEGLTGTWGNQRVIANLVVSAGKAGVASRINGSGGEAAFTYIAIGTGATAAAAGDTTLQTEIASGGGSRASATASRVTTTVTNDTAQLVLTYNFTSSFAVTESGVLNAASVGVLLCRQVFSAINVVNGDSLQVTWKIQAS